jgi:cobalt-zinc-cadmium efflux system protein
MHNHAHHQPATSSRAFTVGMALNIGFILIEVVFGVRARSLALLADAGHNLGDVLGLGLAWGALVLGQRPPTPRHTYGMRRASILAALANAVLLLVAVGGIAWEALQRLRRPEPVVVGVVMAVAAAGVLINGVTALLFASGRKGDINVREAFMHMAADAAVSLGVVVAGWAVLITGKLWLDPAASLLIGGVIIWGTWSLLRESLHLAMDAVPKGCDVRAVEQYLCSLPGVTAVHDLHVWGMSTTETALTAHLVKPDAEVDDRLLIRVSHELHADSASSTRRFNSSDPTLTVSRRPRMLSESRRRGGRDGGPRILLTRMPIQVFN